MHYPSIFFIFANNLIVNMWVFGLINRQSNLTNQLRIVLDKLLVISIFWAYLSRNTFLKAFLNRM